MHLIAFAICLAYVVDCSSHLLSAVMVAAHDNVEKSKRRALHDRFQFEVR